VVTGTTQSPQRPTEMSLSLLIHPRHINIKPNCLWILFSACFFAFLNHYRMTDHNGSSAKVKDHLRTTP